VTTRRLFIAIFLISLFAIGLRNTLDPDMWWHLKTGELIWEQGIPEVDPFSYTNAGREWVAHEWLSEAVMWKIHEYGGFPALIIASATLVLVTFSVVYLALDGKPYGAAFVTLLSALTSAVTWGARPQMSTMLLFALLILLLEKVRRASWPTKWLAIVPLVAIPWTNLHGAFLLVVATPLIYGAGAIIESRLRKEVSLVKSLSEGWPYLAAALAALAATLVNPNGLRLLTYPFETLGSSAMQEFIQEWQPPNFAMAVFWPLAAMILLTLAGWVRQGRRQIVAEIILVTGLGVATLFSARHVSLFAVAAALPVSRLVSQFASRLSSSNDQSRPPTKLHQAANWLILILMALATGLWAMEVVGRNESKVAEIVPVQAVSILREAGLSSQRGYSEYHWGGYLIWNEMPVFIDGRADMYGDDFIYYYRQGIVAGDEWSVPLEDHDVSYVMIQPESALIFRLDSSPEWQLAHESATAVIYVRSDDG